MAFLVEVQHQSRERHQGIGYGAVVVIEETAVGCPHGQPSLQVVITGFDEPAEFGKGGFAPCFLPLLAGDGHYGCAMPVAHAGKGSYSLHAASFLAKRRAANLR